MASEKTAPKHLSSEWREFVVDISNPNKLADMIIKDFINQPYYPDRTDGWVPREKVAVGDTNKHQSEVYNRYLMSKLGEHERVESDCEGAQELARENIGWNPKTWLAQFSSSSYEADLQRYNDDSSAVAQSLHAYFRQYPHISKLVLSRIPELIARHSEPNSATCSEIVNTIIYIAVNTRRHQGESDEKYNKRLDVFKERFEKCISYGAIDIAGFLNTDARVANVSDVWLIGPVITGIQRGIIDWAVARSSRHWKLAQRNSRDLELGLCSGRQAASEIFLAGVVPKAVASAGKVERANKSKEEQKRYDIVEKMANREGTFSSTRALRRFNKNEEADKAREREPRQGFMKVFDYAEDFSKGYGLSILAGVVLLSTTVPLLLTGFGAPVALAVGGGCFFMMRYALPPIGSKCLDLLARAIGGRPEVSESQKDIYQECKAITDPTKASGHQKPEKGALDQLSPSQPNVLDRQKSLDCSTSSQIRFTDSLRGGGSDHMVR